MYKFKHIAVSGAFGEGNFGDDLLLLGYLRFLVYEHKIPACKICVVARSNDKLKRKILALYPGISVVKKNFFGFVFTSFNIFAGGTQFYSFKSSANKYKQLLSRISFHLSHKRLMARDTIMLNVGLGPFAGDISHRLINKINAACYVSVRDDVSLRYCNELRYSPSRLGADIGYMPELYSNFKWGASKAPTNYRSGELKALIILRDWHDFDMEASIKKISISLSNKGIKACFYVMSPHRDIELKAVLKKWKIDFVEWHEGEISDCLDYISGFDFLITSRYHAVVSAAVLSIPSICINIEPKLDIVSRQLNTNLTLPMHFSIAELDTRLDDLLTSRGCIVKALMDSVAEERVRFKEFSNSFEFTAKQLAAE